MKKWNLLGEAVAPDGSKLTLNERDGEFMIRVGGTELMTTRQRASEEKLGELACEHLKGVSRPRVLIGGLGFGFTLRAVLDRVPADATVSVVELIPEIIEWNRNAAYPLGASALNDARVTVRQADVFDVISAGKEAYDSILLDVDNGPAALTTAGNGRLYVMNGLQRIRRALRPGGCVAVWSVGESPAFVKLLANAGFTAEAHSARAHENGGGHRAIFVGRMP